MQLRAGVMLPSGLSELHSCKEKVHEASCCGHGKIILIFLIVVLARSVATLENWLKEVSKRENFVFGGGLSEMLLGV